MTRDLEPTSLRTLARYRAHGTTAETLAELCDSIDGALAGAGFGREPQPSGPLWLPLRDSPGEWRACTHPASPTIYQVFVMQGSTVVRGRRPGADDCPPDDDVTRRLLACIHIAIGAARRVSDAKWYRRDGSSTGEREPFTRA